MKFLNHLVLQCGVLWAILLISMLLGGCNPTKNQPDTTTDIGPIWILCEGQFGASDASITAYNPLTEKSVNDIFYSANNHALLGDTPSSGQMYNDELHVTLSGSGKIYILDPKSSKLKRKVTSLNSPRFIEFISPNKAYVTNVGSAGINILNLSVGDNVGFIETPGPAEMMVRIGQYVYSNLWAGGNEIIKIDIATDKIVAQNKVGIQPVALIKDADGFLWSICDGGYVGSPIGREDPSLLRIDPKDLSVHNKWVLPVVPDAFSLRLTIDPKGENVYFVNGGVYKMNIHDAQLPSKPLINTPQGVSFYNIGVNPANGDIYVSDAVDFKQNGWVYRYSNKGELIDHFGAGIAPSVFCFL